MSLSTHIRSFPSTIASGLYSSLEYLHPDLPLALKICEYAITAGVIIKAGLISTKAIVLGTLAYGAYVTAQKIYQAHSAVSPILPKKTQGDTSLTTNGQHVRIAVTVNGQPA